MKLTAILRRMLSMCPEAWYIFRRGLQLSAFLMLCALMEVTQALLLVSVLASAIIEDAQS